jgi:hypothetical protein
LFVVCCLLFVVCCLLFNFVTGIPLAKLSNTSIRVSGTKDLLSQIMLFKDNDEALLSVLSDADPARLNEVITLLKALLTTSEAELLALTTSSGNADTAFNDAVAAHNAAVVAKTNGESALQTTKENAISDANTAYNQGVTALQAAVNAAKNEVDSTNSTKITANALLAADQTRLNTEINTLITVVALMEGVLGINTVSPTSSPTSPPTTADVQSHFVSIGRIGLLEDGICYDPNSEDCASYLANDSEEHALQCCSDVAIDGWINRCNATEYSAGTNKMLEPPNHGDLWGARNIWTNPNQFLDADCQVLNWSDANQFCQSKNGRLCTLAEVTSNCVWGFGCNYDRWLIWTSSH